MGNMIITLITNQGKEQKRVRHDHGGPFNSVEIDPVTGMEWHIEIFSGGIRCYPKKGEEYIRDVVASISLYAPRNLYNPRPTGDLKVDVDRRLSLVANVGGCTMRLQRGYAAVISFGVSSLHVSWDYPEYEHPKVEVFALEV